MKEKLQQVQENKNALFNNFILFCNMYISEKIIENLLKSDKN